MTSQYAYGTEGDQGIPGPAVADGDKGDITVTASGTVYTIDNNAVTVAKMQQIATASILGRLTAATGNVEVLSAANVITILGIVNVLADVTLVAVQVLTNKKLTLSAGSATAGTAPLKFTSGTVLTVAEAGAYEFDGSSHFATINAAEGRGQIAVEQQFMLAADGGAITTIANFFGTNSNPVLTASQLYELEIVMYLLKSTAGTNTITLTNSAAPTWQNYQFEMSPITGIVAPPGTATRLFGEVRNDNTAARTIVTGSLSDAVDHWCRVRMQIQNAAGTSLKIQSTAGAGSITPRKGSFWRLRRLSLSNVGNFAA